MSNIFKFYEDNKFWQFMGIIWILVFGVIICLTSLNNAILFCCVLIGFILVWENRSNEKEAEK